MLKLIQEGDAVILQVKVVPGASRTRYLGEWDGRARIAVAAPAERGKANDELIDFLAQMLDISHREITVISGATSPLKSLRIDGIQASVLSAAFREKSQ